MAKSRRKGAKNESVEVTLADRVRELLGILLFGFAAFLLIAIASFRLEDPEGILPDRGNLCGETGYALAHRALFWFGDASYLGVVILFLWSLALVARRPMVVGPFRLLWLGLFLFSSAALMSHLSTATALLIPDRGGLVGFQVAELFETTLGFGAWGTRLVLIVGVLLCFMLATDMVLYTAVLGTMAFFARRREGALAWVARTGPMFRSMVGKPKAKPKRSSKPRSKPKKKPVEIAVTDEEIEGPEEDDEEEYEYEYVDEDDVDDEEEWEYEDEEEDEEEVAPPPKATKKSRGGGKKAGGKKGSASKPAPGEVDAVIEAAEAAANEVAEPEMLDDLPEAEVVPEPAPKKQAKIRLEPPKSAAHGPAGFESEPTVFEAPEVATPKEVSEYRYEFPSPQLLEKPAPVSSKEFQKMIEANIKVLEAALSSYKVEAEVEEIQKGPVITMFELDVAPGTRVDRIRALEDDLAIRLKAPSVRIVAPIPGKSTIGIEVPNQIRETVCLRELVEAREYDSSKYAVPVFLGKDASGRALIEDLARMPHLLVAGSTGSGKSVCLNAIIMSVLFTRSPDQVKLILIDPKMVELSLYENIPHLMCPVVRDMNRAAQILEWACTKMDERYEMLSEVGARNIFSYNKLPEEEKRAKLNIPEDDETFEAKMPFIVIVVDELADLMMVSAKEVEGYITRLAQKSRAVGIHIILATQRPSTNVITGLIKANMPTRISFQVASKVDARVVLDQNGAEKLLGFGDMLYLPPRSSSLARGQGAFVADEEIKATVDAIRVEKPLYSRELMQKNKRAEVDPREVDDLYEEAALFVCESQRGSASLLQRKFAIGYTRASRLIDLMANDGILGEYRNAQAREVLVTLDEYKERGEGDD